MTPLVSGNIDKGRRQGDKPRARTQTRRRQAVGMGDAIHHGGKGFALGDAGRAVRSQSRTAELPHTDKKC